MNPFDVTEEVGPQKADEPRWSVWLTHSFEKQSAFGLTIVFRSCYTNKLCNVEIGRTSMVYLNPVSTRGSFMARIKGRGE